MVNYAYVNFLNDDDMVTAQQQFFDLNGDKLVWCAPSDKTCHECGSTEHLFKKCDKKKTLTRRNINVNKLYQRYRPAQHRNDKSLPRKYLSYADAANAKPNNSNNSQNTSRIQKPINDNTHIQLLENKMKEFDKKIGGILVALQRVEAALQS